MLQGLFHLEDKMQNQITILKLKDGRNYTVRSNRDRVFYPEEWMKFFDALKEKQKFTFSSLINTGARINEIRNVQLNDIDLKNKRIVLRVTKVRSKLKEKIPRPRIIPISTTYSKYLKKYLKEYNIIDSLNILATSSANEAMKKALVKAGIKDYQMFSVHNVRKTLETWLIAIGVEPIKVMLHIGHRQSVAMTNYLSPDYFTPEEKRNIREVIGDLYQKW
jgi:integrase